MLKAARRYWYKYLGIEMMQSGEYSVWKNGRCSKQLDNSYGIYLFNILHNLAVNLTEVLLIACGFQSGNRWRSFFTYIIMQRYLSHPTHPSPHSVFSCLWTFPSSFLNKFFKKKHDWCCIFDERYAINVRNARKTSKQRLNLVCQQKVKSSGQWLLGTQELIRQKEKTEVLSGGKRTCRGPKAASALTIAEDQWGDSSRKQHVMQPKGKGQPLTKHRAVVIGPDGLGPRPATVAIIYYLRAFS